MEDEERLSVSSDFANLLRRHRLACGLSQDALAERARMSAAGISALERGRRLTPQHETIAFLAQALGLNDHQRVEFKSAARSVKRVRGAASVAVRQLEGSTALDSPLTNNLPCQFTPLIGRDDVLVELEPFVLEHRLVSLVGTGGVGKTRLALQVGANLLDGCSDGVWFVDLATLSNPASVVKAITATFGLHEKEDRPMLDVLVQYLRPRRLILIADNCEHLIEEVARVADAILRGAPQVRVLATSREPLRIGGERVYLVPSLAVPSKDLLTTDEALQFGAIALFAERAKAADAKFTLTDDNAATVAEICRCLDGIPLAVELAAARVTALSLRQLAGNLKDRFRVLSGGRRTALPRHQTMQALIDWSHDLLSEHEQRLFRRVAIFAGGWSLKAAEGVCGDRVLDALEVFDLISSLVQKSLVIADLLESPRYRLLESIRAFALEKLVQCGERERLARRHAQWAGDSADRAYEVTRSVPTAQWLPGFALELGNAREAIEWALRHDDVTLAARIVVGFSRVYRQLGEDTEPRNWLMTILPGAALTTQPVLAGRAWLELAAMTIGLRRADAAQRAVEFGEQCDDPTVTVNGLAFMANGLSQAGRTPEAHVVVDRAVRLSKEHGLTDSLVYERVLNTRGWIAVELGKPDEARDTFAASLVIATARGDDFALSWTRLNLAELELQLGNAKVALELVRTTEAEARKSRMTRNLTYALANGAAYRIALGDTAGARIAAREALRLARGGVPEIATIATQHLASLAALAGDIRRAGRLCGYVDACYRRDGYARSTSEQCTYEILMSALQATLSEGEIKALTSEGARLSEDQAVAEALAL